MVSSRSVSAVVCVAIGAGCIVSVLKGQGGDSGAMVTIAADPLAPKTRASKPKASEPAASQIMEPATAVPAVATAADVDTALPTGSIAPGSALHAPNPAAYADAAKVGSSLILTGAEAVNYLAGNTLRREGPGEPLHFTYFASRGLMGEGSERGFTARRWEREKPELCEPGAAGGMVCRTMTILLDGKYEFPGARLGTVTLAAAGEQGPQTAVLVKGNAMHFPDHIPFLDSSVDLAGAAPAAVTGATKGKGADVFTGILGHPAAVGEADGRDRQVVLYATDNRRLELQQIEAGTDGGRAVRVTVGHWRTTKATLCETRVIGDLAQACFKPEALADGGIRLVPTGKAGSPLSLRPLSEAGARETAQD